MERSSRTTLQPRRSIHSLAYKASRDLVSRLLMNNTVAICSSLDLKPCRETLHKIRDLHPSTVQIVSPSYHLEYAQNHRFGAGRYLIGFQYYIFRKQLFE